MALALTTKPGMMPFVLLSSYSPKGFPPERRPSKTFLTPPFTPVDLVFTPAFSKAREKALIRLLWYAGVPPPREYMRERRVWPCASAMGFPEPPALMRRPMY